VLVYGPVPSRRLGHSLGIDLIPLKICSYDCIYCQLGRTTDKTIKRREYAAADDILADLQQVLTTGAKPDYITLAGSGEPTLNSMIGEVVARIKQLTDIPVVILTNGSLFWQPEVRQACLQADIIAPSLDAADEKTFHRINLPHPDVTFENMTRGLIDLRREYRGEIWLEILLLKGINDSLKAAEDFKYWIEQIKPDKVQLNTSVRPGTKLEILRLSQDELETIRDYIGGKTEIIATISPVHNKQEHTADQDHVLDMIRRRPCTLEDVANGLNLHRNSALKYLSDLERQGKIQYREHQGSRFYQAYS